MTPRQHQIDGSVWALETIREYGLAYLIWKERTGKTLTALLAAEHSKASNILIVTKKKAIPGWVDALSGWKHVKRFTVINYESIHKLNLEKFDFIILDEAHHAISGIGRPSKTWKAVKHFTKSKPILYLSATPYAEHVGLLFNQFHLSEWSPFRMYKDFFAFYKVYGIPNMVRTPYGLVDQRNKYRTDDVLDKCQHLFNFKTRQDVGIEHEPTTNVVIVPMDKMTAEFIDHWTSDGLLVFGDTTIMNDSDMKGRMVHYQIEGSTIKASDSLTIFLNTNEKVEYIKANYDEKKIAIMAHFIKERELLKRELPNALILSSDGDAEGVDLSHVAKLIVYSMSFKTSKHTQRLARQANHNRAEPIEVDILVCDKPGIGLAVYESVAVKEENFTKSSYERGVSNAVHTK